MTGIITEMKTPITKLCKEMIYSDELGVETTIIKLEVIKFLGIPIYKYIKETGKVTYQSDGTITTSDPILL